MRNVILKCTAFFSIFSMLLTGCAPPDSAEDPADTAPGEGGAPRAALSVSPEEATPISGTLFGLFLEDINFAVDAGLYAELIKNRSFEYGSLASGGPEHGWYVTDGSHVGFSVADGSADGTCLHKNNPSYAVITNTADTFEGIYNTGYLDGLAVAAGETYHASLYVRGNARLQLSLEDGNGTVYAEAFLDAQAETWTKLSADLIPSASVSRNLRFVVRISRGSVCLDMISLMPEDTFAGLPIRKDLGEALQALNPTFLRFPGGCVIEGKSEDTMYNWKDSVGAADYTINGENAAGDVASRPQVTDIWSGNGENPYYCTYGLGFYEYFMLCEALDCIPVPIVNAGMTCPVQSQKYVVYPVSGDKFKQCVQDALDLVEFCRGGADTVWGSLRVAMGHEEPFELKYIGIGNEQWQGEYHAHYMAFVDAFEEAAKQDPALYGGIELIVANGPSSGSTEGWSFVSSHPDGITTLVDEHYYEAPSWFLANTHRYDSYSRDSDVKVFLGEYAAQSNTMNAALAEAAYMTALERNGDVVTMACYAPLFGNATLNQWTPDMIFFSNRSVCATPNYYVQQMFAGNAGSTYLKTELSFSGTAHNSVLSGMAGLGSWMTSVAYDNLKVVSNADGKVLYANDFEDPGSFGRDFQTHRGSWSVKNGCLVQENTASPADTNTGDAAYFGSAGWTDYTLTVDARILGGAEGFLIPVCVKSAKDSIFWNIGGWGNTVSCLQIVSGGAKSGQISGTVRNLTLEKGRTYTLTVTVSGNNIKCFIDGQLYVDYTQEPTDPIYASTVRDENGDLILKLVNITGETIPVAVNIPGLSAAYGSTALVTVLRAGSGSAVNSFSEPDNIRPEDGSTEVSDSFTWEALPYSLTVIRIPAK